MSPLDQARRLVIQHARTAALLGVDAVPVRRAGSVTPPPEPAARPEPARPEASRPPSADAEPQPGPALWSGPAPSPRPRAPKDRDRAQRALDEVRARYEADAPHQHFVTSFTNIVFGEGDPAADLVFVGEAPGQEEDRTGRPFVGRAGQLLDKMIAAMGLSREQVYICNVLKTRPPDNATPTSEEARLCAPYLFDQLRIIAPRAIVALGLPAARTLLDTAEPMARLRGRWHAFTPPGGEPVAVMPTYHPAFLLRSYTPENRQKVWADLQMVMARLREP